MPLLATAATPAKYKGGTVPFLLDGTTGTLETMTDSAMSFNAPSRNLVVPYTAIESFAYTEPVARHMGVLPAIAVGLLKHRQHLHLFRITYRDDNAVARVAIFEVPKQAATALNAVLITGTRKTCSPSKNFGAPRDLTRLGPICPRCEPPCQLRTGN